MTNTDQAKGPEAASFLYLAILFPKTQTWWSVVVYQLLRKAIYAPPLQFKSCTRGNVASASA